MLARAWLSILVLGCGGAPGPAPSSPETAAPPVAQPPVSAVAAQAALTEQYDVGKALYVSKKCASCHGDHGEGNPKNPAVIGPAALPARAPAGATLRASVTFATAKDVLDFVRAKMPIKEPGTLTDEEAAAVTSWLLSESKVDFAVKLDAATAGSIKLR